MSIPYKMGAKSDFSATLLGTHGRGVLIADDIAPLEQFVEGTKYGSAFLCEPRPAVHYRSALGQSWGGDKNWNGPNPTRGAVLQFFLNRKPTDKEPVKLTVLDRDGKTVVRELRVVRPEVGLNRVVWDMRHDSVLSPARPVRTARGARQPSTPNPAPATSSAPDTESPRTEEAPASAGQETPASGAATAQNNTNAGRTPEASGGQPQAGGRAGQAAGRAGAASLLRGPRVLPGIYMVKLSMGDEQMTRRLVVEEDERVEMSPGERRTYFDTHLRLVKGMNALMEAQTALQKTRMELVKLRDSEGMKGADPKIKQEVVALIARAQELTNRIAPSFQPAGRRPGGSGATGAGENASGEGAAREGAPASESNAPAPATGQSARTQTPDTSTVRPSLTRLRQIANTVDSLTEPLSRAVRGEADGALREALSLVRDVNTLNSRAVASLNRKLTASKLAAIEAGETVFTR